MKRSSLFLFLLSSAIVAFGQPAWAPWLAPIAAIGGYALFWRLASRIHTNKTRFWTATAWFGLVQLIQLSWMTSIEYQGLYILAVYLLLAIGLGLQFGLLTLLIHRLPFIATAALWTLMEWARLYFICGFSWNPVGMALAGTTLSLQASSIFGVLGLSFWVVLTNLVLWKKRWKAALSLALCPYLFGAFQWSLHRTKIDASPCVQVALVQTGLLPSQKSYLPDRESDFISPYEQWSRITTLLSEVKEPVDLVVLPESAVPFPDRYAYFSKPMVDKILRHSFGMRAEKILREETSLQKVSNQFWVQALGRILQSDVVIGMDAEEGGKYFSSAFFYAAGDGTMHRYDKQILLPLAEYIPFESLKVLTKLYGITEFFTHGKKPTVFHSKVPISVSICYEETFGHLMRQGRKEGADLFVNLTNDNWYPNSRLPKQHFDLAKLQAVANGIPLVRACNSGITSAVDSLGRVIAQLDDWNEPNVLVTQVSLYHFATLYTLWGDKGIVVVSIILLVFCFIVNKKSLFVDNLFKSS